MTNPCTWIYSGDDYATWNTACGRAFCMIDGTPKENDYDFCPSCGGELHEAMHNHPADQEPCPGCGFKDGHHDDCTYPDGLAVDGEVK